MAARMTYRIISTTIKPFQNHVNISRSLSSKSTFLFSELEITKTKKKSQPPDPSKLLFGHHFSEHMFEVEWHLSSGWDRPKIVPFHNLVLHPACKVLHYATELFEGMKAYRSRDDKLLLFRPELNIKRLLMTAERTCLPSFDPNEFLQCLKALVKIDADFVPKSHQSSLYIRPTFISIDPTLGVTPSNSSLLYIITGPVGPYFPTGLKPVSLLADPNFVRAWPKGCGDKKMGANYAPTIAIHKHAMEKGFQQILWLFGDDHQLTEVGTMNIFMVCLNEKGEKEVVTPPLDGLILPGITRYSLLELCRKMNDIKVTERTIPMKEIISLLKNKKLLEIFGAGTACVVCPVERIHFDGTDYNIPTMSQKDPLFKRLLKMLTDIQYGAVKHEWSVPV